MKPCVADNKSSVTSGIVSACGVMGREIESRRGFRMVVYYIKNKSSLKIGDSRSHITVTNCANQGIYYMLPHHQGDQMGL
jgi:hypothetical protein